MTLPIAPPTALLTLPMTFGDAVTNDVTDDLTDGVTNNCGIRTDDNDGITNIEIVADVVTD